MEQELYELPEGWEWKKLAEICTVVSGTTPKTSVSEYWNGQFNWITPAELNDTTDIIFETQRKITEKAIRECSLKCMPQGTVLLSSRAPIGKVAIAGQKMYCNQGFKNLICSSSIFNKFLFYYLKSKTDYLNSLGKGTTFKEISKKIVENIYIPRPILLPEQQRIAHKLDTVLGRIGKAISLSRENLESLNTLFASLLQQAFDPLGKAENENLYELPEGWEWKKLAEICTVVSGTTPKTSVSEYWNGQFNWITPAELNDTTDIIFETQRKITEKAIRECSLKCMPQGTVLLSSRAPIGKVAIAGQKMYCNQGFKNLICSSSIFNKFLFYYLKSKTDYLNSLGKGTTFKEISKKIVENIYIPRPILLPEQQRIAHKLDVLSENIEAQKKTLQEKIDELNNLKNSILDAAFRGQL